MTQTFDPRLTPARDDLAADFLQGKITAPKYVAGTSYQIAAPVVSLYAQPDASSQLQTQLLYGEPFEVFDKAKGWAWGQAGRDQFVGYICETTIQKPAKTASHFVSALRTPVFQWPDLKAPVTGFLHRNSLICAGNIDDHYVDTGAGWVHLGHVQELDRIIDDWVETASSYLHTPYVWGGRSSDGLDCSALVQNALLASGRDCPRDSDMQETALGQDIGFDGDISILQSGDLVFWKGHVGIMLDAAQFLHANAFHMMTAIEPIQNAITRINKTAGPVSSIRRLDR